MCVRAPRCLTTHASPFFRRAPPMRRCDAMALTESINSIVEGNRLAHVNPSTPSSVVCQKSQVRTPILSMRLACVPCVVRNTCPRCTVGPRASPSVARASRISHHASCTFNSIQRTREASFHPTTMTMTTTTVTTVRPMGWMRVVERRTSSIAHGDDHATRRRSAAQRSADRRTTHDGRLTRRTTRTGATTDGPDAPRRPPRVVLDAYCLRIYKYEAGISNIYPEVGVSNRGGATHGHMDACVRGPRACARWMWMARACACACAW